MEFPVVFGPLAPYCLLQLGPILLGIAVRCIAGDPCLSHTTIDEPRRSINYPLSPGEAELCDSGLRRGWYRFHSLAGGQMPTACVSRYSCGTPGPVWMMGTHPEEPGQIAQATACAHVGRNCCQFPDRIQVRNCGDFFVYYLNRTRGCGMAYCAGTEVQCPPGQSSPTGFTPDCQPVQGSGPLTEEGQDTHTTYATLKESTVPFTTVVVAAGLTSGFFVSLVVFIVAAVVYKQRGDVIYGHESRSGEAGISHMMDLDGHRSRERVQFPHLHQNRLSTASNNDYVYT
ncbi:PREDICTED: oncoprotein-induced transcript 3 protein-like [Branchiostoma belcheri]|uniref:Oncoprotein-induced transcript 3 protein-like n=1 Tax=Branchiostoma belcheri TaxID=7741 RepID=A0A6P4YBC4_BRABE|nr:PREDICTED: oncoprotein-induced transcript 3 protein-like [Branchiostoma belcheri]